MKSAAVCKSRASTKSRTTKSCPTKSHPTTKSRCPKPACGRAATAARAKVIVTSTSPKPRAVKPSKATVTTKTATKSRRAAATTMAVQPVKVATPRKPQRTVATAVVANTRRRQIDPTTCERDYSTAEVEFMNALDDYKRQSGRLFPTCSEILEVVRKLGYTKAT